MYTIDAAYAQFEESVRGSLSPGKLVIDGRETEVRLELKDLYSALEEAKADVLLQLAQVYDEGGGPTVTTAIGRQLSHDDADASLQWCGRALEKGFRSLQLDAVATLATAVLLVAGAGLLDSWLGLPEAFLRGAGLVLLLLGGARGKLRSPSSGGGA